VSPEEKAFSEAVEKYEMLLHSETQAIVSIELDKLEQIIEEKQRTLDSLLTTRNALTFDPRDNPEWDETLDRILKIQSRNSQTLNDLIAQQSRDGRDSTTEETLRVRKIRTAYLSQHRNGGRRFEV